MDLEQLRLRADPLRKLLSEREFPVSHNQALDLLASLCGLRNWPEARAFPDRVAGAAFDDEAAGRLSRRIAKSGGPTVTAAELLERLASSGPELWPDGPRPGIYVCADPRRAMLAIARYVRATQQVFYTDSTGSDNEFAIELGEAGIFSAGLRRAATGTLVVMHLQLDQDNWEENESRMTAAWNAASAELRVIVVCSTENPDDLQRDIALLTRGNEGPDYLDPYLVGVVTDLGEMLERVPFVPARQAPKVPLQLPASALSLPENIAKKLSAAVCARPTGSVIAGMYLGNMSSEPLQVVAAMLPLLVSHGPTVRVGPHTGNPYDKRMPIPEALLALSVYSSVESAIEDGAKVILLDCSMHVASKLLARYGNQALFVMHCKAMGVGRAFTHVFAASSDEEQQLLVDTIVASVCVGSVRGKSSKPLTWDMYVHVDGLRVPESGDVEEPLAAHRAIRWEDQVFDLMRAGEVSEKSVRKDYPYLNIRDLSSSTKTAVAKSRRPRKTI